MRIVHRTRAVALLSALLASAGSAAAGDPADEKNWLDERTWPAFASARELKVTDTDDETARLLKERYNAGQQELRSRYIYWLQGEESLPQVYEAARRVTAARLEAGGAGSDKVAVLKEKVAFARVVEKQAEALRKKFNRAAQVSDEQSAKYFRADAELELLRAEKAAKGKPGK
jgi:hypothetical protein